MAKGGDAEIYEKHAEELLRFATILVGPDAAPDVLSAAVLQAIAGKSWPNVENRRSYLFRCVLNQARLTHRSFLRRRASKNESHNLKRSPMSSPRSM
jgi:DNA-directed RNA polymerase specialized sigma24 family protein